MWSHTLPPHTNILLLSSITAVCLLRRTGRSPDTSGYQRKLKLKTKFVSRLLYFRLKRLVPGAFNVGLIRSTCAALPRGRRTAWY